MELVIRGSAEVVGDYFLPCRGAFEGGDVCRDLAKRGCKSSEEFGALQRLSETHRDVKKDGLPCRNVDVVERIKIDLVSEKSKASPFYQSLRISFQSRPFAMGFNELTAVWISLPSRP